MKIDHIYYCYNTLEKNKLSFQKYGVLNTVLKIIDINLLTYKKLNKLETALLEKVINKTFILLKKNKCCHYSF